jgi:type III secretion protein S
MSPDIAMQQLTEAMVLVMVLSMPPIIAASVVGILISLLQAVKLIAVSITLALMAGMLGSEIVNFSLKLFNDFPRMI